MFDKKRLTKEGQALEVRKIFNEIDNGKLGHDLSRSFTRPLYAHTKAEVGGRKDAPDVQRTNTSTNL